MSVPLKIKLSPITHPFPTPTFLCLASFLSQITFFVTNFPSLGRQRLQGHAVYSPWFSWRQSHHSILASEAAGFSQGFLPSWTSSHFNVMFDSKLLFCFFCLVICCRSKTTQLILKVVVYLSIFEKKRTMNWSKPPKETSKNNYFAMKKLEIRTPFAFSLFQNLYLVVI